MNAIPRALKEHILTRLGTEVVRELPVTKQALLSFGLSSDQEDRWETDAVAFSIIVKSKVLVPSMDDIVDEFVREFKGRSYYVKTTTSFLEITHVHHIEGLRTIMVNRVHRKLNIAILNTG